VNRIAFLLILAASLSARAGDNWPMFRGGQADAHSDAKGIPTTWSETEHVKWKVATPGQGWSSPVVWGDQIWFTYAIDDGKSLHAICVDKRDGHTIHDGEVFHVDNPAHKHDFNSYASPTPVLEEGRAYICFGANGSTCLDTKTAKPIWTNLELKIDHINGPGSSPIIYDNLYLLCCDGGDYEYVAALDKNTGKIAWKTSRSFDHSQMKDDLRKAYNTPMVIHADGKDQLISIGAHRVYSYDVHTGKELWFFDIPGFSNVAQPVWADGMLYVSTGFGKADLWAVRTDGSGDVSKTHVAWKFKKGTPCRSTPLLVGDGSQRRIFMVTDAGIGQYVNPENGEAIWTKRMGATYSASPMLINGLIYCFDEKGSSFVLKPADTPEILVENHLDDGCMGTPAITGKAMILRTKTALYRIEE
jgi:outer membrane protein assembly factor BamB